MRLEVLSDQGDTLRTSLIHTFLLTAYLYTTFGMVSTTVPSGCASTTYGIAEHIFSQLGYPLVVMVKPSQDRNCHHLVPCMLRGTRKSMRLRNLLLNPLMRSCPVEVGHIDIEHTLELLLMKDQQVVEAFLSHTSQEAFADRIRSGSMIGRVEYLYSTRCRYTSETGPKFAIVITHQIFRCLPIGSGFAQLLRHPGIGRGSRDSDMDYPSCLEFDEEERKERSKEEVAHLQEVASPDLCRLIAQKGSPSLSSWLGCANVSDVLLDGSLAHINAQLQQFSTNPLSTPQSILHGHLPAQDDGFGGYLRLMQSGI
jgi:hypothetical protein